MSGEDAIGAARQSPGICWACDDFFPSISCSIRKLGPRRVLRSNASIFRRADWCSPRTLRRLFVILPGAAAHAEGFLLFPDDFVLIAISKLSLLAQGEAAPAATFDDCVDPE